jgi:hypothetical protein
MTSLRRKARRFQELDWPSRRLVLGSAWLLPLFWARVKLLGRCDLGPRQSDGALPDRSDPDSLHAATHMGRLVNSVAHHVLPPDNCLTRSLYLQWLLRRRGMGSDLRLGVQLDNGQLFAHAWVEVAGHAVNDREDVAECFLPLQRSQASLARVPA